VIASEYTTNKTKVEFNLLEPNTFYLRVIYDDNKNKKVDTGNYLEKLQTRRGIHFPKPSGDVRPNWDDFEFFDLSAPYIPPEPKQK
jgi:hypothetical protein